VYFNWPLLSTAVCLIPWDHFHRLYLSLDHSLLTVYSQGITLFMLPGLHSMGTEQALQGLSRCSWMGSEICSFNERKKQDTIIWCLLGIYTRMIPIGAAAQEVGEAGRLWSAIQHRPHSQVTISHSPFLLYFFLIDTMLIHFILLKREYINLISQIKIDIRNNLLFPLILIITEGVSL
jgi:hypothetical protein